MEIVPASTKMSLWLSEVLFVLLVNIFSHLFFISNNPLYLFSFLPFWFSHFSFFLEEKFEPFFSHFLPFIQRGLTYTQESSLIKNCVGLITDLAGVLRKGVCVFFLFFFYISFS